MMRDQRPASAGSIPAASTDNVVRALRFLHDAAGLLIDLPEMGSELYETRVLSDGPSQTWTANVRDMSSMSLWNEIPGVRTEFSVLIQLYEGIGSLMHGLSQTPGSDASGLGLTLQWNET